jgi:ankyrin repeat protein
MLAVRRDPDRPGRGIAVAAALIDAGADLSITNERKETVLHIAAQSAGHAASASVLLRSGADRLRVLF